MGETDNYSSLYNHLFDQNDPGNINGPLHAGGNPGVLSAQALNNRQQKCYSLIVRHLANQNFIDSAEATFAALQAAAGNAQLPADWVRTVWDALNAMGSLPVSGLTQSNQMDTWINIKLSDVGIDRETVRNFYNHLLRIDRQQIAPVTTVQFHIKFCQAFSFPASIRDKCIDDLQVSRFIYPIGHALQGHPWTALFVDYIEELWHNLYDRNEIKPSPAPKGKPDYSNRVDGMSTEIIPLDMLSFGNAPSFPDQTHGMSPALMWALSALPAATTDSEAFLREERDCWNCKGWGHTKEQCPSAKKARPLSTCIRGLTMQLTRERGRLNQARAGGRKFIRRPGTAKGNRMRAPAGKDLNAFYVYDDGSIYSPDGTLTGLSANLSPDELCDYVETADANILACGPCAQSEGDGIFDMQTSALVSVEKRSDADISPKTYSPIKVTEIAGKTLPAGDETKNIIGTRDIRDTPIDTEFGDIFGGNLADVTFDMNPASAVPDDPFEYNASASEINFAEPWTGRCKRVVAGISIAMLGAVALTALVVRSKSAKVLMIAAMCSGVKGFTVLPTASSSQFRVFSMLDTPIANGKAALLNEQNCGVVDTGATRCASYKSKLFPTNAITQRNPPFKVRIADGSYLPVVLEGSMAIKTHTDGVRSAKKVVTILAAKSLLVPSMRVTLISPKSLFQNEGVRTYFNDELCFVLPNGDHVCFTETDRNYLLFLDDLNVDFNSLPLPTTLPGNDNENAENALRLTLSQPLPITLDLVHQRAIHFSPDKIKRSLPWLDGVDTTTFPKGDLSKICDGCVRGAFRGHRKVRRERSKFTHFGQCVFSDSCAMPVSTPFGYCEMYVFFDAYSEFLALYFGKTTTAEEMLQVFKQFLVDYGRYMKDGVELWVADGGPEFKSKSTEDFCREMHTRRKFIAPWSPWQNMGETAWRIILRPIRVSLASANAGKRLWPFAASQAALVYNMLSPYAPFDEAPAHSNAATAFVSFNALLERLSPIRPSPLFLVTGRKGRFDRLRVLFCKVEVRMRNHDDLRRLGKLTQKVSPVTTPGIYLGDDPRRMGCYVYLFDMERFTSAAISDIVFFENIFPPLDHITGDISLDGVTIAAPNAAQQRALQDPSFPDLELAPRHDNPTSPEAHDNSHFFPPGHCVHPACTLGHHSPDTPHSFEQVDSRGVALGRGYRQRVRLATNVASAVEGDTTGTFAAFGDMGSIFLGTVDGTCDSFPDGVPLCVNYNLDAHVTLTTREDGVPQSTDEALNGPHGTEWKEAYLKEYRAKVANGTFKLVPRPANRKVVSTKVAHAHKAEDGALLERRARWVGRGFSEIFGKDYDKTYTATPYAISLRTFFVLVCMMDLSTSKADVTKAFTLADIDRELYAEQMPGIEIPGKPRNAWVCLLLKALEGLKQAGFLWQGKHTKFVLDFGFKQSDIDPCVFVYHVSSGILIVLVWVDDLAIGYSCVTLYETFKLAYKKEFPSTFEDGGFDEKGTTFTGVTVHRNRSQKLLCLEQRGHIARAYEKFVPKGFPTPLVPAVSDRNSPRHYSKITTASNDAERSAMKTKPFLAALMTLMYVTVFTVPALAYHVSTLGQHMHDPSLAAYDAVLNLIAYAYANRDTLVITYGGVLRIPSGLPDSGLDAFRANFGLHGISDASWLLRSVGGYLLMFCNGPIDWSVRIIKVICHSSAEAEIAAGCMMGKRLPFIRQLLSDCHVKLEHPIVIFLDNTAALLLIDRMGASPKTAHFLRWQFYLRWLTTHNHVLPFFVPTKLMLADPMTKCVDQVTLLRFLEIVSNRSNAFVKFKA